MRFEQKETGSIVVPVPRLPHLENAMARVGVSSHGSLQCCQSLLERMGKAWAIVIERVQMRVRLGVGAIYLNQWQPRPAWPIDKLWEIVNVTREVVAQQRYGLLHGTGVHAFHRAWDNWQDLP
jgi:hypothetical protein